jgi:hypothetical protein
MLERVVSAMMFRSEMMPVSELMIKAKDRMAALAQPRAFPLQARHNTINGRDF